MNDQSLICPQCGKTYLDACYCKDCGTKLVPLSMKKQTEETPLQVYFKQGEGTPFDDAQCRGNTMQSIRRFSKVKEVDTPEQADIIVTRDNYKDFINQHCLGYRDLTKIECQRLYEKVKAMNIEADSVVRISAFDRECPELSRTMYVYIENENEETDEEALEIVDGKSIAYLFSSPELFLEAILWGGEDYVRFQDVYENLDGDDVFYYDDENALGNTSTPSTTETSFSPSFPPLQTTSSVNTDSLDDLNSRLNDLQSTLDRQMQEMQDILDQKLKINK